MIEGQDKLATLIIGDAWRRAVLSMLREECGETAWIGAGFVRNAVWDALFSVTATAAADVDVLIFDASEADPIRLETELQERLESKWPDVPWQVRNQARMHLVNGHPPCQSIAEAMEWWPETATAVAVQLDGGAGINVLAPFGSSDLWDGVLRPCRNTLSVRAAVLDRARRKGWFKRWPGLRVEMDLANCGQFGRKRNGT